MRAVFSCELRLVHLLSVDELIGGAGLYVMSNKNVTCKIAILELGIEPRSEQCECSVLTAILFELGMTIQLTLIHIDIDIDIHIDIHID